MTLAGITWTKDWSGLPMIDAAACPHPGSSALAIDLTLERQRPNGPARIATTATLCMLCGTDSSGQMTADDALEASWIEHGWHRSTGERILDLTRRQTAPGGQA